jgi:mannonate dehydratase
MNRRTALRTFVSGSASIAATMAALPGPIQAAQQAVRRGLPPVKITDVILILTEIEPEHTHFVNVKVLTSEPGLYGVGCATHAERPLVVATAIRDYLKPIVTGRNVDEIEDIWQSVNVMPYWRGGVDANNALSGLDGALWDIMGKRAGLPLYALLGGKLRKAIPLYPTLDSMKLPELEDEVHKAQANGYRHVKIGLQARVGATQRQGLASGLNPQPFEPTQYVNSTIKMFEYLRTKIGFDMELIHTVHERVPPTSALSLAKAVEPYRPFFMEDLLAPEDMGWYQHIRAESSTALAMGSLFVNRNDWLPLVSNRWIDFMRMHISAAGGFNMARKVAMCCEFFNVRTAWHSPGMVSPVGHAVGMHLDFACYNFGIQEEHIFSDQVREVFPGTPEIKGGLMYSNDRPGLGIDIDEKAAAKYPYTSPGFNRGARLWDGSPLRP